MHLTQHHNLTRHLHKGGKHFEKRVLSELIYCTNIDFLKNICQGRRNQKIKCGKKGCAFPVPNHRMKDGEEIVLKLMHVKPQSFQIRSDFLTEILNGILLTEYMRKQLLSPLFVKIYFVGVCKTSEFENYTKCITRKTTDDVTLIAYEKMKDELTNYPKSKNMDFMILQVLIGIYQAAKLLQFKHNDLHPMNVMYRKMHKNDIWKGKKMLDTTHILTNFGNSYYLVPHQNYLAKIIDYDLASLKVSGWGRTGQQIVIKNDEVWGNINDEFDEFYDFMLFIKSQFDWMQGRPSRFLLELVQLIQKHGGVYTKKQWTFRVVSYPNKKLSWFINKAYHLVPGMKKVKKADFVNKDFVLDFTYE